MPNKLIVPDFKHLGKLLCGPSCAKFILATRGLRWQEPWLYRHFPWLYALIPTLPGRMKRLASGGGRLYTPRIRVSAGWRNMWLRDKLELGNTPALFVHSSNNALFPNHWVVVCGQTNDFDFLVYDSRVGEGSKTGLPIGNTVWTNGELLDAWRPTFGNFAEGTVTAVTTL